MSPTEHLAQAKQFLNQAEIAYINGDDEFEVCGIFWQAVAHVVQAAALPLGWECGNFKEQKRAAKSLIRETGDSEFSFGFSTAENMYWHSQAGFFQPFDDRDIAAVRYFVNRMAALALAPPAAPDALALTPPVAPTPNIQEVAG